MSESKMSFEKARIIRRSCYALILLSLGLLTIPMVVSAIRAIEDDQVIDPYTGKLVDPDDTSPPSRRQAGKKFSK